MPRLMESGGKPGMLPTRTDTACQCRPPSANRKTLHTRGRGSAHSTGPARYLRANQLQFVRPDRSSYSQMHILGNRKLQSAWRQCQSGSANTARSFFQDRHFLLSNYSSGPAAVSAFAEEEVGYGLSAPKEVQASFPEDAELAV